MLRFGATPALAHDFSTAFTDADGAAVLAQFSFAQKATDITQLARAVVHFLDASKAALAASTTGVLHQQIVFIISDGRFGDRAGLKQWIHEAQTRHMFLVFVIIDDVSRTKGGASNSILELKTVSYPGGKLKVSSYMDDFPFPFYVVLRDIHTLPDTLASALRQWFELTKNIE